MLRVKESYVKHALNCNSSIVLFNASLYTSANAAFLENFITNCCQQTIV